MDLKEQYKVPFFVLNDQNTQLYIRNEISGFCFIDIFSSWLSCQSEWISDEFNLYRLSNNEDQKRKINIYFNKYRAFDSLYKVQEPMYPVDEIQADKREVIIDECVGNIDDIKEDYASGWVACRYNNVLSQCDNVGAFLVDSKRVHEYMIANPVKREDVSNFLNSKSSEEYGFDVFIKKFSEDVYIGYVNNFDDKIVICKNLKVRK